jgi:hypothetical protein
MDRMHVASQGEPVYPEGIERRKSVDDAIAELFPDATVFGESGAPITAQAPAGGAFAPAQAVPPLALADGLDNALAPMLGLQEIADNRASSGPYTPPVSLPFSCAPSATSPVACQAAVSSAGTRAPAEWASQCTPTDQRGAGDIFCDPAGAVVGLPPATMDCERSHFAASASIAQTIAQTAGSVALSRAPSGYSAVLSGDLAAAVIPAPLRTPSAPGSFLRAASSGFSRTTSVGTAHSRASSVCLTPSVFSRASSTGSMSDSTVVSNNFLCYPGAHGTILGEKRGRGKPDAPSKRRPWTADEHARFVDSLARFGQKDRGETNGRVGVGLGPGVAELIAVVVGTRTVSQVRSHAQKYFLQLSRTASAVSAGSSSPAASTASASVSAQKSDSADASPREEGSQDVAEGGSGGMGAGGSRDGVSSSAGLKCEPIEECDSSQDRESAAPAGERGCAAIKLENHQRGAEVNKRQKTTSHSCDKIETKTAATATAADDSVAAVAVRPGAHGGKVLASLVQAA